MKKGRKASIKKRPTISSDGIIRKYGIPILLGFVLVTLLIYLVRYQLYISQYLLLEAIFSLPFLLVQIISRSLTSYFTVDSTCPRSSCGILAWAITGIITFGAYYLFGKGAIMFKHFMKREI